VALHWRDLVAVSTVTGCGFTVSLLIAELAFPGGQAQDKAKGAVLAGSLAAALIAAALLSPQGPAPQRLTYLHDRTSAGG
jgi:NhaA family Na+:H+ antiporter